MLAGEGLAIGHDVGDQPTQGFPGEQLFPLTSSTIKRVVIDVSSEPYIDLEREARVMLNARIGSLTTRNGP